MGTRLDIREEGGTKKLNGGILRTDRPHSGRRITKEERQVILEHPEFVWLYLYFDKRGYEKAQKNHNISFLKKTLPEELFCKIVTIKYITEQQAEGVYIEDGEDKLFGYTGYNNYFPLVPNTDVAIVTDDKSFWAFIKRDAETECFYGSSNKKMTMKETIVRQRNC